MATYIGAIDQGTTSTRFMVFDHRAARLSASRRRSTSRSTRSRVGSSTIRRRSGRAPRKSSPRRWRRRACVRSDLAAIGITNQRETTVVWDRKTGKPVLQRASSGRTPAYGDAVAEFAAHGGQDRFRAKTGLPLATYFSGLKIRWVLENVPALRAKRGGRRRPVRQHRHLRAPGT